uniref:Kelch repeat and BTB domain-containing protein 8 n=1 Tax=Cajanus cajan TaxID=3821 RepID=A0A151S203_CAJCA|nr:Kelch repeat and BTB domain-containing protein 8 [Cajanus cajan]
MKDLNSDLFDPVIKMESEWSRGGSTSDADFAFAFNDSNFSDRLLRIEIMSDPVDAPRDSDTCATIADWARHRKRRREDIKRDTGADLASVPDEQILKEKQPDVDECENQDEEAVAMVEEPHSGDEATNSNDSDWSMDCSSGAVVRVKTLHISSPILAAKSPFFYKLFSNGMRESEQRHVTLRINASEEAALMELLNFMYSNTLSTTTAPALLDVLMAADKFEVASCMRHCSRLLRNMPMTPDSALLYLELPSSVLMADAVQPLTDAAKQYLAGRYKDITKFQEEVMALPLAGVEAILSSDDLQVASEDAVYDFVLKWSRQQYPKLEERREVLGARLARLIRFPYMTCRKLKKVLTCSDFDHDVASKLVLEGLFFKAEAPHRQRSLAAEDSASSYLSFAVDYEFAARSRPTEEFVSKYKGNYVFTGGKAVGYRNLFAIPWTSFTAEDSLYFINGVLHLRAELTIRH